MHNCCIAIIQMGCAFADWLHLPREHFRSFFYDLIVISEVVQLGFRLMRHGVGSNLLLSINLKSWHFSWMQLFVSHSVFVFPISNLCRHILISKQHILDVSRAIWFKLRKKWRIRYHKIMCKWFLNIQDNRDLVIWFLKKLQTLFLRFFFINVRFA